jgi:hypothetical protein
MDNAVMRRYANQKTMGNAHRHTLTSHHFALPTRACCCADTSQFFHRHIPGRWLLVHSRTAGTFAVSLPAAEKPGTFVSPWRRYDQHQYHGALRHAHWPRRLEKVVFLYLDLLWKLRRSHRPPHELRKFQPAAGVGIGRDDPGFLRFLLYPIHTELRGRPPSTEAPERQPRRDCPSEHLIHLETYQTKKSHRDRH